MDDVDLAAVLNLGRLQGFAEVFVALLDGELTDAPSELARAWGQHAPRGVAPWPEHAPEACMIVLFQLAPDELDDFVHAVAECGADDDSEAAAQT